jgi:hypothetical protein
VSAVRRLDEHLPESITALVDLAAERALVAAIIREPRLLGALLAEGFDIAVADVFDPIARQAFTAVRNLEHAGSVISDATVVGELERVSVAVVEENGLNTAGVSQVRDWLQRETSFRSFDEPIPTAIVLGWARRVIALSRSRMEAVAAEQREQREQDEIDASALDDCQPDEDPNQYSATRLEAEVINIEWKAARAKALADVRAKLDESKSETSRPLFGTDAVDLLSRKFDGARWIVTGLITKNGIGMIGAEPKAAKTWLGTETAIAVATGTKVCGEYYAEFGTVAYFYCEDIDVQVRNRVRALLAGAGRTLQRGRLHLQPRGAFLDVLRDEDLAWLVASCRQIGAIDLLVLDPLRDLHSGEEDKSDSMRNVMRRLRVLVEVLGCTVLVVHHAAKATKDTSKRRPGQNLRGSGAIHGSVDSGLYLEDSAGDGVKLFTNTVVSQVKGARSAGRFKVELAVEDDDAGEAVSAAWKVSRFEPSATARRSPGHDDDIAVLTWVRDLAMTGVHLSCTALRKKTGRPVSEKRVTAALNRLLEDGRLRGAAGLVYLPGQVPS